MRSNSLPAYFGPVLALSLSLVLTSCSSSDPAEIEPAAQELKDNSKPAIDTPENQLLSDAMQYYQAGLYSVAIDAFEKLRDGYPLGPYAEFAEIKVADSHFESSDFVAAAGLYEEFLRSRPDSTAIPYILLRVARSNQLANRGVGRDTASLKKALEFYDQLLTKYPSSPYSEGAAAYREQVDNLLAAHEKEILEFYKKRDKQMAYEARKEDFSKRYGKQSDDFELSDSTTPVVEKLPPAPQGTRVLVETNLSGQSLPSSLSPSSLTSTASLSEGHTAPLPRPAVNREGRTLPRSGLFVRFVECVRSQRLAFVHLSAPLPSAGSLEALSPLAKAPGAGSLVLRVPGLSTVEGATIERDCFGTRDLVVRPSGEIEISTKAGQAEVMELSQPPRILFALK